MGLWIQLRVNDVRSCGVDLHFGPSFVQQIIVVLFMNGNAGASIRAEEKSFTGSFIDEQTFQLLAEVIGPGVLQQFVHFRRTQTFHRTNVQLAFDPILRGVSALFRIVKIVTHAMWIVFARMKTTRMVRNTMFRVDFGMDKRRRTDAGGMARFHTW